MAKQRKKWRLGRRLKIVEAIPGTRDPGQEKPILEEFLNMEIVKYESVAVNNQLGKEDRLKQDFLDKLFARYKPSSGEKRHRHRYVHISAHGDGNALGLGVPENRVCLTTDDLRQYCEKKKIYLQDQMITLSACGSLSGGFAETLLNECGASVVIRPLNSVDFQESAMFFILFYFLLSRRRISFGNHCCGILERSDEKSDCCRALDWKIQEQLTHVLISEYIDVFQRTKASYLNVGGTGTYRLDYRVRCGHRVVEHNHLF